MSERWRGHKISLRILALSMCLAPLPASTQLAGLLEKVVPQKKSGLLIEVEGLDKPLRDNVAVYLRIEKASKAKELPPESRIKWLHAQAEKDIKKALTPFGYYEPEVESDLRRSEDGWIARYSVNAGQPVKVTKLDVRLTGDAEQDPAFQQVLDDSTLAVGKVLNHAAYESLKGRLQSAAASRGYFQAEFEKRQIEVDLEEHSASIDLWYDSGPRFVFGEVGYPVDPLNPEFLSRYQSFKTGDPYNSEALLKLQAALSSAGYFESVAVDADPTSADSTEVPVTVALTMEKQLRLEAGLGFSTDDGPRVKAGAERRWINSWGHHYRADFQITPTDIDVAAEYGIPSPMKPLTDEFLFRIGYASEDSDVKNSERLFANASWRRNENKWDRTYSIGFQQETFTLDDVETTSTLLLPSAEWTRLSVKDPMYVENGSRFKFFARGAHEALLSDVSFAQLGASAKWIHSLPNRGRIILRGELGTTYASDFDQLPTSLRFYTGGDKTVRGYNFETIGPENDSGDVVGGKHLVVASAEYEHPIIPNWGAAVFVDVGDAFNNSIDPRVGVGIGARWKSPVGPVRIDLATGLDDPGDNIRLHLTIGPDL